MCDVSYHALREMPQLEASLKEALRLHPPLIILMRKVLRDFVYKGWLVKAGKLVAVSPAVSCPSLKTAWSSILRSSVRCTRSLLAKRAFAS